MISDQHNTVARVFILMLFLIGGNELLKAQNNIRPVSGKPGPDYWQQEVNYQVNAELHPETRTLSGTASITYVNHSPDTLRQLYWHLYYNLFDKNSDEYKAGSGGRLRSSTKGITIEEIALGSTKIEPEIDGTVMRTELPQALQPGQSAVIEVSWTLHFPPYASLRTGSSGRDFSLTQWYPQIAVYDDRRGWDKTPYTGKAEFYLEYGDWDVELKVPSNYTLAATGILQNPEQVLTSEQLRRYRSIAADSVSQVITKAEAAQRSKTTSEETATWHFKAESVRDFAVAASPAYIWEATKTGPIGDQDDGVFIHAVYQANGLPAWQEGADMARHAIEFFSDQYGVYVYPQATVVSGPVTGMEYPMMVYAGNQAPVVNLLYMLIAHELGHEWYPMMIGSDETHHAFMDEGFNTFITSTAFEDRYPDTGFMNPDNAPWIEKLVPYIDERMMNQLMYLIQARANEDASLSAHSNRLRSDRYNVTSYAKPGSVMYMLRSYLGEETFRKALLTYYDRWLFKHPYPEDFYRTVEDVANEDLSWFWNQFMVQTWSLDQAITGIKQEQIEDSYQATLRFENNRKARMPIPVTLELADGSTKKITVPLEKQVASSFEYRVTDLPSKVRRAEIDPELWYSDINRLNNTWPLPKLKLQAKPYFLVEQFPPVDAYWMGVYPNIWYNSIDGVELGLAGKSSYMGTDYALRWAVTMGTASGEVDGMVNYESQLPWVEQSGFRWGVGAYKMDGRSGGELSLSVMPGTFGNVFGDQESTSLTIKLLTNTTSDTTYLYRPSEWSKGDWSALRADFSQTTQGAGGQLRMQLGAEGGAPESELYYGKIWGDLRWNKRVSSKIRLIARVTGGYGSGEIPSQSAFYLAQASPYERFSNRLLRSKGLLQKMNIAEQTLQGGGGSVVSASPIERGKRMFAINTSIDYTMGILETDLFYNTGDVWSSGSIDAQKWRHEIGIGAGFMLPQRFGAYRIGNWGLHLKAPMFTKKPGAQIAFDPSLQIVLGHRWGL